MDRPSGGPLQQKTAGIEYLESNREVLKRVFEKNKNKNRQSSVKRHTRSRNLDRNPGSGLLPGAPPIPEAEIGAQTMTFAQLCFFFACRFTLRHPQKLWLVALES